MKHETTALLLCLASWAAQAEPGPYVQAEWGRSSVTAGAAIGGVDVLRTESRPTLLLAAGWRVAVGGGWMLGADLGLGTIGGNLERAHVASGTTTRYAPSGLWQIGAHLGTNVVVGADPLFVAAYVAESKRRFDVTIDGPLGVVRQTDRQGLLRFGMAVEGRWALDSPWRWRVALGRSRADFGDRPLDQSGTAPWDLALGIGHAW